MPEYNFAATVQEEIAQLSRELGAEEVRQAIHEMAQRFGTADDVILAALWRASKRHGETLTVFVDELRGQFERETAAAEGTT
ncbi:MAG TPA: hypothetical protein VHS99_07090 [Chloroflexota bacterium]|jgi:hypothetical protein|nr:hypothetical protein [Chloroflexota bacterium]